MIFMTVQFTGLQVKGREQRAKNKFSSSLNIPQVQAVSIKAEGFLGTNMNQGI
jgi:hypothetical protein